MSTVKTAVNQQFSQVADYYRTSRVHAAGTDLAQIAQQVQQTPPPYVLDAGCGAGHTAMTVAPHSRRVVAFDLSEAMLAQVRQLATEKGLSNVETKQGDVEQLPFEEGTFDTVVSRYSAHHWPNPAHALREFNRVLKPGGRFILSDIVSPPEPAQDSFLQTLELLRDPSHVRDHTLNQWQAMFEEADFAVEVLSTWPVLLHFDDWVQRMKTPELNTAMLKALFDGASEEIRHTFAIQPDYDFTIGGALLVGHRR